MPVPSAILAISSLDRYTTGIPNSLARKNSALINLYTGLGQPGNNFQLSSNGAFIYGYMTRIAISQTQLDYRVPTVVPSNNVWPQFANDRTQPVVIGNDTFPIFVENNPIGQQTQLVSIPYGFYTPTEMAAILTAQLRTKRGLTTMTVTYTQSNPDAPAGLTGGGNGFIFTQPEDDGLFSFYTGEELETLYNTNQVISILKTYRLLGIEQNVNRGHPATFFYLTQSPNFLYTPFIDIVSNNLTKFQKVKDSDTSVSGRTALIQRFYLSSVGNPQPTSAVYALGSQPFLVTADMNTRKIIRWNKDETVYNLDFELYDQYGDPLFWTPNYPTEFQMTLLCYEADD
jgi:hypothetical protein